MFKKIRAWFERRRIEHEAAEYDRGRRWAHNEIIFGQGYDYVAALTHGVWGAFDRGAHESLRAHAMNQMLLGREVNERTRALAEEHARYGGAFIDCAPVRQRRLGDPDDFLEYERAVARTRRAVHLLNGAAVFRSPPDDPT